MLRKFYLQNGVATESTTPIAGAPEVLYYVNPSEDERREMIAAYEIDEHSLNSCLDPDELSRLEFNPEGTFMIFKHACDHRESDDFLFKVASVGLFLLPDKLLIISAQNIPPMEGKYFLRLQSLQDVILRMLYRSIFHFLEHLKLINAASDSLEAKVNSSVQNKSLINLFSLEKSLVFYLNALNTNSILIEKLRINASRLGLNSDQNDFIDDMIIENNQCIKQAEIYSNILASLMDARVSIVSNNLNGIMKTLTLITIGIMLPTFVVSAFSMNVKIPLATEEHAFWLVLLMSMSSLILLVIFWRWKKW